MQQQPISFPEFDVVYQDAVRVVFEHWTEPMQTELARHCHAWGPGRSDFRNYLEVSSIRFYKAYRAIATNEGNLRICDVGGFWGVFPLTLKKLGYDVSMTESLQYYGDSFDGLFECILNEGVTILDYDPFDHEASLGERFDVLTIMAVLEHYPHSLKTFMRNIRSLMLPNGRLFIEVPNIAYWPKRIELLFGRTPLAQLTDIFDSEVPFIGHHHEFTIAELRDLVKLSGFKIIYEDYYNYTLAGSVRLRTRLRSPLMFLAFPLFKETRECLAVYCRQEEHKKHAFVGKKKRLRIS
jgi:2-polyprenyl-3-methyl-5-hydroxy-6-metoxy-1,4-benzoquinol methylase